MCKGNCRKRDNLCIIEKCIKIVFKIILNHRTYDCFLRINQV